MGNNIFQYLLIILGFICIGYTIFGIRQEGFNLTGRDSPMQIEGGLALFLILSGVALVLYGAINIWFRK